MERKFHATEIGKVVTDLLVAHFQNVMDPKFTSHFEEELDQIERKEIQYEAVLNEFWGPFSEALKLAEEKMPKKSGEETGEKCPKCGLPLVKRYSKKTGKEFISCSGWKKDGTGCDYVKRPEGEEGPKVLEDVKCPNCGKPMVQRVGFRGAPFLGCSGYPKCKNAKPLTAELKEKLKDVLPPPPPKKEGPQIEVKETCPECGSPMKLRHSARGPFLGCSKYPKCKGTRPVPEELLDKV